NGQYNISNLVFSPDGKTIACSSNSGQLQLFDALTLRERMALPEPCITDTFSPDGVAFSPDGKLLFISDIRNGLSFWDISGPEPKKQFVLTQEGVSKVAFARDGKTVALAPKDTTTVRLWD